MCSGSSARGRLFLRQQPRLHRVEALDVGDLELQRLRTCETHRQQREAVAGEFVGGTFFAFRVDVFNGPKIRGVKFRRAFGFQVLNAFENVIVPLAEILGDGLAGGDGVMIVDDDKRRAATPVDGF